MKMISVSQDLVQETLDQVFLEISPYRLCYSDVIKPLTDNGIKVYVVGGTPRNWLLGQAKCGDVDIVINVPIARALGILRASFPGIDPVLDEMKGFGLLKWGQRQGKEIDINILRSRQRMRRAEGMVSEQICEVGESILEDALLRDFSINALYYDMAENLVIDPFGHAEKDIAERTLRIIMDPEILEKQNKICCRILLFMLRGYRSTEHTRQILLDNFGREIVSIKAEGLASWLRYQIVYKGYSFVEYWQAFCEYLARFPEALQTACDALTHLVPWIGREVAREFQGLAVAAVTKEGAWEGA